MNPFFKSKSIPAGAQEYDEGKTYKGAELEDQLDALRVIIAAFKAHEGGELPVDEMAALAKDALAGMRYVKGSLDPDIEVLAVTFKALVTLGDNLDASHKGFLAAQKALGAR